MAPIRWGAFAFCLAAVAPSPAWAFVCTAGPECPPEDPVCSPPGLTQAWNQRCIPYWIRRPDPLYTEDPADTNLPLRQEFEALVIRSFNRWSKDVPCTDIKLVFAGYADQGVFFDPRNPEEQKNMIVGARDRLEIAELGDPNALLAVTETSFSVETGEILDADIVFNRAVNPFDIIKDLQECRTNPRFDIENTLVHEIGHFIGFDHVDDEQATMLGSAQVCEIIKRDLFADEIDAVCSVYPPGQEVKTCRPPAKYDPARGGDPSPFRGQCERALDDGCRCVRPSSRSGLPTDLLLILVLIGLAAFLSRRRGPRRT